MKKILLFISFIFTLQFGVTFASELEDLEEKKEELLENYENYLDEVLDEYSDFTSTYSDSTNYKILKSLDSFSGLNLSFDSSSFNVLKNELLLDFVDINTSITSLESKKQLELVSTSEYDETLDSIQYDINNYFSKYSNSLQSEFSGEKLNLSGLSLRIDNIIDTNSKLLELINNNITEFENLLNEYNNLSSDIKDVSKLYLGAKADIYEYMDNAKSLTKKSLKDTLEKKYATYISKYKYLAYSNDENSEYLESLVLNYGEMLDEEFDDLFDGAYSEADYDALTTKIDSLKGNYKDVDGYIYEKFKTTISFSSEKSLLSSLQSDIKEIKEKFDGASTSNEVNSSVQDLVVEFYENKKDSLMNTFEKYLDKELELLEYKVSSQLNSYNIISEKYSNLDLTDLSAISELKTTLKSVSETMIDADLKDELVNDYWTLVIKEIDLVISSTSLSDYYDNYPSIENELDVTLSGLKAAYQNAGDIDILNSKLSKGLAKIDTYLADSRLSGVSKFLLLKIRKYFIKTLYL